MRTGQQSVGDAAEELVAQRLVAAGWQIRGRNVRVGRNELDIVAVDPGPPARLVAVEVRWRRRSDYGSAAESLDHRKRARLRAAMGRLVELDRLPDGSALPGLPAAIDLVTVEPAADGRSRVRHYRDALSG